MNKSRAVISRGASRNLTKDEITSRPILCLGGAIFRLFYRSPRIALLHCVYFSKKWRKRRKEYNYSISNYILDSYINIYPYFTHFSPPSISAKMQCNAILQYGMNNNPKKSSNFVSYYKKIVLGYGLYKTPIATDIPNT